MPDGAVVRHALEEYIRTAEREAGYRHVYSPVLGKRELYEISGHWSHYSEDMFPPMELGGEKGGEQVVLRPSLCPHHAVIYRSRSHSYRELPLRMAELGGMYRSELSGVLGGLTRVRAIQLNDAHIFCTLDQVAEEAQAALEMIRRAYEALGISPARYRLSLPGPGGKYVAAPELWQRATALLTEVLDRSGLPYEAAEGEAAFYGPKIDVLIRELVSDGTTVFLTTQYLEEADELADRIAVLNDGKIAAEGSAGELKRLIPGGHVRLRFTDPAAYRSAAVALREASKDDEALSLIPSDGSQRELRSILDWLDSAGVEADELTVHTPDLDDVFFALTGGTKVPNQPKESVR